MAQELLRLIALPVVFWSWSGSLLMWHGLWRRSCRIRRVSESLGLTLWARRPAISQIIHLLRSQRTARVFLLDHPALIGKRGERRLRRVDGYDWPRQLYRARSWR